MTEFYSHRTFIGNTDPDRVSVDMARAASAYKVLSESLAARDTSLVLTFPPASKHDDDHTVIHVYWVR